MYLGQNTLKEKYIYIYNKIIKITWRNSLSHFAKSGDKR